MNAAASPAASETQPPLIGVAVVSGAAGGIGREVARLLVRRGASVVLVDLAKEVLDTAEEVGGHGIVADIALDGAFDQVLASTIESFGRVDFLFNNAGIEGSVGPLADATYEAFERVLRVNVGSTFLGTRAFLRHAQRAGTGGAIVNTCSVAGIRGFQNLGLYVASKHAIAGLTRTAAIEGARHGVRVNAALPGHALTEMSDRWEAEVGDASAVRAALLRQVPMRRYADPAEIAEVLVWLASPAASYLTGALLPVDGGATA